MSKRSSSPAISDSVPSESQPGMSVARRIRLETARTAPRTLQLSSRRVLRAFILASPSLIIALLSSESAVDGKIGSSDPSRARREQEYVAARATSSGCPGPTGSARLHRSTCSADSSLSACSVIPVKNESGRNAIDPNLAPRKFDSHRPDRGCYRALRRAIADLPRHSDVTVDRRNETRLPPSSASSRPDGRRRGPAQGRRAG